LVGRIILCVEDNERPATAARKFVDESIPAVRESERIRLYKRMADPTTAEGQARMRSVKMLFIRA
jgi:hypothetical protein